MATNNFKPFAIGSGANVVSQADYESAAALISGFQSGKASSAQINKAIRQSSVMAYVLAQFIADSSSADVLDNGTPATILANLKSSMTALTPGRLLNVQYITVSGPYTPTPGTRVADIEIVGAGGGGGGTGATLSNTAAVASGGNSGAAAIKRVLNPAATSVTIGIGGAGGAGDNPGSAGGGSSFGSIIFAPGGKGGLKVTLISNTAVISACAAATEISTGGDVNIRSGQGNYGSVAIVGSGWSGKGGDSIYGPGAGGVNRADGVSAINPGSGGSGSHDDGGGPARVGGKGANGICIIREYA